MNKSESEQVMSLLMGEAHRLSNGKRISSETFAQAAQNTADAWNVTLTEEEKLKPEQLLSETSRANQHSNGKKPGRKPKTEIAENAIKKEESFLSLYRKFAELYNTLPPDYVLVHFCQLAKNTPDGTRFALRKEGYDFLPTANGSFRVTQRPKLARTADDIGRELQDAMANDKRALAAKLLLEFMELIHQ